MTEEVWLCPDARRDPAQCTPGISRVGMTEEVSWKYFTAAPTPDPGLTLTPQSIRVISTPAMAPSCETSFMSPRWPIWKTSPWTRMSPTPIERLYLEKAVLTMSPESMPRGTWITVRALEYQRGFSQSRLRPQALTARRVPSASRAWRANTFCRPSSFNLSSALCDTQVRPRPGGRERAFCEPETITSTPHSSIRRSAAPREETASTMRRAGCLAASMASRIRLTSEVTPVVVSLCVKSTALILPLPPCVFRSSFRHCSIWASSAPSPPAALDHLDLQAHAPGHVDPEVREGAHAVGDDLVPRAEGVPEGRLPRAGARGGEDEGLPRGGLEEPLEVLQEPAHEVREARVPVVLAPAHHGALEALGHVGGAGHEQVVPPRGVVRERLGR